MQESRLRSHERTRARAWEAALSAAVLLMCKAFISALACSELPYEPTSEVILARFEFPAAARAHIKKGKNRLPSPPPDPGGKVLVFLPLEG